MIKKAVFILIVLVSFLVSAKELSRSMIVLTTTEIKDNSAKLNEFIHQKEIRGFKVLLATEGQFGGSGLSGVAKALKIREWLKTIYKDYSFLLIIGDPASDRSGIPMFVTRPLHEYPEETSNGTPENVPIETDMLYADLTGNWDKNGNSVYGETGLDDGEGGINFEAELITGRIPVYDNDVADLDKILALTIKYMNMEKTEISYRNRIIFPAGFYFFRGLSMMGDWDSAGLGEWAANTFLKDKDDIEIIRMYEAEGVQKSLYESDVSLNKENLINEWSKGTGAVFWGGHTFYNKILRLVWDEDENSDGLASMSEISMPELFNQSDAGSISGNKPGFLISPNCDAGVVKEKGNLTHSLLKTAVVGVMAATTPSTPSFMDWDCYDCEFDKKGFGSDTAGIFTLKALFEGANPAKALFDAKLDYGTDNSALTYANRMSFNWYGDPALTINSSIEDIEAEEPDDNEPDADAIDEEPDNDTQNVDDNKSSGCSAIIF
ncbi:MAG TPA: C25 family cysteine peptidase [bacterium]|nr:C25 family cysteine peptidase [bacterium]HPS28756.1 C25 family cysteine peptidase [bacterium]